MSTFYVNYLLGPSNLDFTTVVAWFVIWFRLLLPRALYGQMKTVCTVWALAQVCPSKIAGMGRPHFVDGFSLRFRSTQGSLAFIFWS